MVKAGVPGYEFVVEEHQSKTDSLITRFSKNNFLKWIYKLTIKNIINPIEIKDREFSQKILPKDIDLIFSTSHLIIRDDKPWILDVVDKITSLEGYDYALYKKRKDYIRSILLHESLKKILVFTEACRKDFIDEFKSPEIEKKIEIVHITKPLFPKKRIAKSYKKRQVNLLFIGSINNPDDFLIKGGLETLETFKYLQKKFSNLHLSIRCNIPPKIKEKYKDLPRLHIIEKILSQKELDNLYKSADIFMTPSHNLNGLAPVEAMSYSLPMIAIDTWAVEEVIIDNINGLIVKKSDKIDYAGEKIHLDTRNKHFLRQIQEIDNSLIKRLANKTERLIVNPKLRKKLGENGRKMVESGEFSFKKKQKLLKRIFDEAVA